MCCSSVTPNRLERGLVFLERVLNHFERVLNCLERVLNRLERVLNRFERVACTRRGGSCIHRFCSDSKILAGFSEQQKNIKDPDWIFRATEECNRS